MTKPNHVRNLPEALARSKQIGFGDNTGHKHDRRLVEITRHWDAAGNLVAQYATECPPMFPLAKGVELTDAEAAEQKRAEQFYPGGGPRKTIPAEPSGTSVRCFVCSTPYGVDVLVGDDLFFVADCVTKSPLNTDWVVRNRRELSEPEAMARLTPAGQAKLRELLGTGDDSRSLALSAAGGAGEQARRFGDPTGTFADKSNCYTPAAPPSEPGAGRGAGGWSDINAATIALADNVRVACGTREQRIGAIAPILRQHFGRVGDRDPGEIDRLREQLAERTRELAEAKEDHGNACHLVAQMHAAAVGEITGPKRGVVEDVADVRAALTAAKDAAEGELARLRGQVVERQVDLLDACKKMQTAIETGEVTCDVLNGRFWEAKAMMYEAIADRLLTTPAPAKPEESKK